MTQNTKTANQTVKEYLAQRKPTKNETVADKKTVITLLPAASLKVCPFSQRALRSSKHADYIANNYNPNLFDPLIVSYRNGSYYVIDGQHRLHAVKKRFGNNYIVECRVIKDLSLEDEAELFVKLNSCSKPLQYADKAKGLYYSGDKTMTDLVEICKKNGIELGINDNARANKDGRITAVKALVDTYEKLGSKATERVVRLLNDTWDGKADGFKNEMIKSVATIISLYGEEVSDRLFIRKLSKVDPRMLIGIARNDVATKAKTEIKIARIMINNYYNKGKGAKPVGYKFSV